jgi:hypothetical protein
MHYRYKGYTILLHAEQQGFPRLSDSLFPRKFLLSHYDGLISGGGHY